MPRYLISFDAHAMDHIPDEEIPAVTNASLAVVQEAINAGVWVFGGGLENQKASIVSTDGTVTDGPYPEAIGGLCVVDVRSREEALEWAAKTAVLDDTRLGQRSRMSPDAPSPIRRRVHPCWTFQTDS
jgi:hypothetical protein